MSLFRVQKTIEAVDKPIQSTFCDMPVQKSRPVTIKADRKKQGYQCMRVMKNANSERL